MKIGIKVSLTFHAAKDEEYTTRNTFIRTCIIKYTVMNVTNDANYKKIGTKIYQINYDIDSPGCGTGEYMGDPNDEVHLDCPRSTVVQMAQRVFAIHNITSQ